jgi:hypothetical protein
MTKPDSSEYAPYYEKYISLVPDGNLPDVLAAQTPDTLSALRAVSPERSLFRYAPGKWSLRESLVHMTDGERIFTYRALRIARGDKTPLPGFEQDDYIAPSQADARSWESIVDEHEAVRGATMHLFRNLPADAWTRMGIASEKPVSVRALAYITAGHELHHLAIMRKFYL